MLPLAGPKIPDSPEALAQALESGLAARDILPRQVTAEGKWPTLDLLRIDLTGSKVAEPEISSPPSDVPVGSVSVSRFEILAAPAEVQGVPIHVRLHASDAVFDLASAGATESLLLIKRVADGEMTVEVARADLERLLHSLAAKAAGEHGVDVKGVSVSFTSRGPRAVSMTAELVVKMFIATATLKLSGDVDLDEGLNARLNNLRFHGDGMVANLAGGFIRPQLTNLEGRKFALMNFALGEITLRDVQLQAGETLRLTAQFGS